MSQIIKRRWFALPVLLILAIGGFLYKGLGQDPSYLPSTLLGKQWPSFAAESLYDPKVTITKDHFLGEPALVNVWATWCPTCKAEHEFLKQVSQQDQVTIYGINYHDDRDAALRWLEELGDPYKHSVYDPDGVLGIDLGVVGAPETYLIDSKGTIIAKHIGELNARNWLPLREQLLALREGAN